YRKGLELQGGLKFKDWIYANANLTVSSNQVMKFTEFIDDYDNGDQKINNYSKTDISFSPDIIASATITMLPLKNGEVSLMSKYVGRQYLDNTGNKSRSLADFYVEDLRMMYT